MGKLQHGAITAITNTYNVHRQTIRNIWERARENFRNEDVRAFTASPRKKGNCGRKKGITKKSVTQSGRYYSIKADSL